MSAHARERLGTTEETAQINRGAALHIDVGAAFRIAKSTSEGLRRSREINLGAVSPEPFRPTWERFRPSLEALFQGLHGRLPPQ